MASVGEKGKTRRSASGSLARHQPGTARGRASALALLLAFTTAAVAGCGAAVPGGAGSTQLSSEGGFGWFAYGDPAAPGGRELGTPADAVERAGLRLPDRASVQEVETQSFTEFAESYVFVFQVDAAAAAAFCAQDGLGGARPVPADRSAVHVSMGDLQVTAGSRWCEGTASGDPRWSRHVLIDAGDPATVHLSLQRTGSLPVTATPGAP